MQKVDDKPKPTITFEFDPKTNAVTWQAKPGFPANLAVNALELAKYYFLEMQIAQMQAAMAALAKNRVVMPDGSIPPP